MKKCVLVIMVIVMTFCISLVALAGSEKETSGTAKEAATAASDEPCVDEWVFPNLMFMTGGWAPYGEMIVWGMNEAIDEINAAGGIRGIPVRAEVYDTGTHQPELAVTQMAKVLDTKPLLIMGPHGSTDAEACSQLAYDEGVYMLQSTSSYDVAKKFRPWANVWLTNTEQFAKTTAQKWIEREPDIKSVVMFVQPEASTWYEQSKHQSNGLKAVGVKVLEEIAVTEAVDFSPLAVRALSHKPDGFVMYCYPEAMVKIVLELQKRGVKENRRFLFFHGAGTPEFWALGKGYLDGAYQWSIFNSQADSQKWQKLADKFREDFDGEPNWTVPTDYDSMYLIKKCFEDLKITGCRDKLKEERVKIQKFMNNVDSFEFATMKIKIVDGEYKAPAFLYTIKGDKLENPINCGFEWK
jgi:branched-chain amino acid transport system substrate-binding protein